MFFWCYSCMIISLFLGRDLIVPAEVEGHRRLL